MANEDSCEANRVRAIDTLLSYKLSDSDMSTIALQSNARTAAFLARCKQANKNMFLKPIPPHLSNEELEEKMRDLLITLSKMQGHNCLKYFLSKAFPDYQIMGSYFSMIYDIGETMKQIINLSKDNVILSCLEALVHHCSVSNFSKDLVSVGGLSVLASCYQLLGNQHQVNLLLSKLIMSISLHCEHCEELHRTGWIGILSEWCKSNDTRLGSLSATALSNLDCMSQEPCTFGGELFLIHPKVRAKKVGDHDVDVVFLHGFLGGLFFTWRQRRSDRKHFTLYRITSNDDCLQNDDEENESKCDAPEDDSIESEYEFVLSDIPVSTNAQELDQDLSYSWKKAKSIVVNSRCDHFTNSWPMDWLAFDCQSIRVIGANYDTRISTWLPRCPLKECQDNSIAIQSDSLLDQLAKAQVGTRPLVWIAHSMGGLLLKYILLKASSSESNEAQKLVSNTKAIVFMSTPHLGSPLASLSETSRFLLQTPRYINDLRLNSPQLIQLHKDFLDFLKKQSISITTFLETKRIRISSLNIEIQCVPPDYGNPQTGEIYEIPVSHMDICKPGSKMSFIYQKILEIVVKIKEDSSPCQEERYVSRRQLIQ